MPHPQIHAALYSICRLVLPQEMIKLSNARNLADSCNRKHASLIGLYRRSVLIGSEHKKMNIHELSNTTDI